ncbi:MAG: hypothetical protein JW797_06750 [Bradymonadales bacterium]|nr:hypothetical protein [Bradymonadales bacterium]
MNEKTRKIVNYSVVGAIVFFLMVWTIFGPMESPFSSAKMLGTWIAAFLSLCILSFLYQDNPFYKFAESLFIGISAGYYLVYGVWTSLVANLLRRLWPGAANFLLPDLDAQPISTGGWLWYFLSLVLGIMLLWRLVPKGGWISRWPLAVIVGWSAGTNLTQYLVSDFTKQIQPSMVPLIVFHEGGGIAWMASLDNIVLVGGLICALLYFFFSVEHKGAIGKASRVGIWVLMITFGAAFGYTVMGRVALLVGRMEFIFTDWLQMIAR